MTARLTAPLSASVSWASGTDVKVVFTPSRSRGSAPSPVTYCGPVPFKAMTLVVAVAIVGIVLFVRSHNANNRLLPS